MSFPTIHPQADTAWVVRWDDDSLQTTRQITALTQAALREFAQQPLELIPGLATLTFLSGELVDDQKLGAQIETLIQKTIAITPPAARIVELPICYDGEFGPDLPEVAQHAGLSIADVIARHLQAEYLVAMLGFSPGFPYLRGLPAELATPRRTTPRVKIPAGSVGIAGTQTGIYPQATPGGWQLIGRTPVCLFALDQTPPTLLQPGDLVRFRRIEAAEFAERHAAAGKGEPR